MTAPPIDARCRECVSYQQLPSEEDRAGQGDVTWVVLADPEGNEFCVLGAARPQALGRQTSPT